MLSNLQLDPGSGDPLYRQLYDRIVSAIRSGELSPGDRLPATRELAGKIGLNRTTITAAYELLESEGLIRRHVGRGSFVAGIPKSEPVNLSWPDLLVETEPEAPAPPLLATPEVSISFATSRPAADLFPLDEIRATTQEVIDGEASQVLQLGSPTGYPPLRRYLLRAAEDKKEASGSDEIIVTSGCQQALDLLQRVLIRRGDKVAVEDPVYPGIHHVLTRAGAQVVGIPVGAEGIQLDHLEAVLIRERPKLLIVTPDFQNPTGATLPFEARQDILRLARESGTIVAENDIYAELRYEGAPLPSLKQLDETGDVIQMRSFSKIAFPGLRVGWVLAPRPVIARLVEAKQWSDLHTDQLAQAVLCRFAASGRLDRHHQRVVAGGRTRLAAALAGCEKHLPPGARFTRPSGGMNLWIELPEPLDAGELLPRAQKEGVSYLPGRYFGVSRHHRGALRLSFAGLAPDRIEAGLSILGNLFRGELDRVRAVSRLEPAPAMV